MRQHFSIDLLFKVAKLARSTFYYWRKQLLKPDKYIQEKQLIKDIFHQHKGRYGYRRITVTLRKLGVILNHKTVQNLMRSLGLRSLVRPKRYCSYKGKLGKVANNILNRDFKAFRPNEKWVTDITEFNVKGKKLYLSALLDLYNSEVIAYEVAEKPTLEIIEKMLSNAARFLNPTDRPMLHSDQGWQYQMASFQQKLKNKGIAQSMSRSGNCLDNAVVENFFGILKTELFYLEKFDDIQKLSKGIDEYIYYYNNDRIKMKLGGLSPIRYKFSESNVHQ